MKVVLSWDARAFLRRERDPDFVFFFSFGCYFPEEKSQVKGAMSDRLCLYSPSFRGDLKLLKVWGWVTAWRCLCDAYQTCAGHSVVCLGARTQPIETEGTDSEFSNTCYSRGQSFLLTPDISPRLISFSCRGRQDQTNVV